ncbi:MAG: hypothetical protein M0R03_13480 [Novosphingobium sp.]|nr:hypothetical protein [Novosphingobium sp.]
MSTEKMIKKIISKYNPDKFNCVPNTNKYIANSDVYSTNSLEIACLLTGYKKIYMTLNERILNKIDPCLISIIKSKKITKKIKKKSYFIYYLSDNNIFIKEKKVILYTKSGFKNSLFMQLRDTELNLQEFEKPGSHEEFDNPYLNGLLLNYKKSDIKFFYQVNYFRQNLNNKIDIKITDKNQFAAWPFKIKNNFYDFIKKNWIKSENYELYKRDRLQASEIINSYNKLSIYNIKILIRKNLSKIRNLLENYL